MSAFVYLTYEQVKGINERHCGTGAGVLNESGIRAQLGRVEQTFGGEDFYPTVWEKAAVLLHGLSSTQYFSDGNKRTAWIVTDLFLSVNGHPLRDLTDVEAEAFVLAIATRAFENEDEPTRGIEKATEWFEDHRLRMRDRCHFAVLAERAAEGHPGSGTYHAENALLAGIATSPETESLAFNLILSARWHPLDEGQHYAVRIYSENTSVLRLWAAHEDEVSLVPTRAGNHPHHQQTGIFPTLAIYDLDADVIGEGTTHVVVEVGGEVFARVPLTISIVSMLSVP